jgi:hypothetical protein
VPITLPPDRRVHALPSWPRVILAIVLGAATFAACGGGGTAAPGGGTAAPASGAPAASAPAQSAAPATTQAPAGGGTVDVCALITTDEVAAIVGKPVTIEPDTASEDWAAGQCWWNGESFNPRFGVTVGTPASIAMSTSPTAREQYDLSKLAFGGQSPDLVSGLGDEAFFGAGFVFAYKGGTFVQALGLPKDQLVEVVKLVLAKL